MRIYSEISANSTWREVAADLLEGQANLKVDSRCGETSEIIHAVLQVTDPHQRWIPARIPALNPAFALAEVIWIMSGRNDTIFLEHWFPTYASFVGGSGRQYGAYGARLRKHHGMDQIYRAYEILKAKPNSRQVVLQIWSARDDLPKRNGEPRSGDIPCNLSSCLKIRDGQLHWLQIVRSNDIDRGLPYNLVQFTMLQEIMAGWLGIGVGDYVHVADSLHIYHHGLQRMSIDKDIEPDHNSDRFDHGIEESLSSFGLLTQRMEHIMECRTKGVAVPHSYERNLPKEFENMFAVIAADDARRYNDRELAKSIISRCENPVLRQLWDRWNDRVSRSFRSKMNPLDSARASRVDE